MPDDPVAPTFYEVYATQMVLTVAGEVVNFGKTVTKIEGREVVSYDMTRVRELLRLAKNGQGKAT